MLPSPAERQSDGRPKQIRYIQIALWTQAIFALCGGNYVALAILTVSGMSAQELADAGFHTRPPAVPIWAFAIALFVCCLFAAMAASRLGSRLPIARKWGIIASISYFVVGSALIVFVPNLVLVLAIPLIASVTSLTLLFGRDAKEWFAPEEDSDDEEDSEK